jgi:hypothetical protein
VGGEGDGREIVKLTLLRVFSPRPNPDVSFISSPLVLILSVSVFYVGLAAALHASPAGVRPGWPMAETETAPVGGTNFSEQPPLLSWRIY